MRVYFRFVRSAVHIVADEKHRNRIKKKQRESSTERTSDRDRETTKEPDYIQLYGL